MQMAGLFSPSLGTGQGHTTTNSLNIFMFSNIIYIYTYIYIYMLSFCFGSEDVLVPTASTQAVELARTCPGGSCSEPRLPECLTIHF